MAFATAAAERARPAMLVSRAAAVSLAAVVSEWRSPPAQRAASRMRESARIALVMVMGVAYRSGLAGRPLPWPRLGCLSSDESVPELERALSRPRPRPRFPDAVSPAVSRPP